MTTGNQCLQEVSSSCNFFPSSDDGYYVYIEVISWMKLSVLIFKDQAGLQQAVD